MSRKIILADTDNIVKQYRAGVSTSDLASQSRVSKNVIYRILSDAGITLYCGRPSRNRPTIDEMLAIYNTGIGISGVAKKLGAGRMYVIIAFKKAGIETRNPSQQQFARMARSTPEEIAYLTSAAHKACKGRQHTDDEITKRALTRFNHKTCKTSIYENTFADELAKLNIVFTQQAPVSRYNCDFIVNGVAVEIFGGGWHNHGAHLARFEKRTRYLFNAGFHVLIINASKFSPIDTAVTNQAISLINSFSLDKSSARQYRVIWCRRDYVTGGSSNDDHIAFVQPYTNRRNVTTGRYECIPR